MKKSVVVTLFLIFVFMFTTFSFISAQITDDLHLNIQATDGSGDIESGTFDFVFNVSTSEDCNVSNVVYSNSTSLTTDSRGIVSYYLPNVTLDYDTQYYLCYYRDGSLESSSKLARVPYAFRATDINLSEVTVDTNLNLSSYNISTTDTGFFGFLGSLVDRVTTLFVQDIDFNGEINGSGNITTLGNVTADYFIGDGSLLTGISSGNSSFNQTLTDSIYYSITNPFGFYNSTTLQNVSQLVNDFGYYNVTTLPSSTGNSTAWNRSGTNVFLANIADFVGIGTSTPQQELNVVGDGNFTGNVSFGGLILYGENTGAGAVLNEQTSSTNPTIVPSRNNLGYGLGYGSQSLHLIVNDLNIFELFSDRAKLEGDLNVTESIYSGETYGFYDGSTQPYAATPDGFGWHVSTASFNQLFSVSSEETTPTGVFFKPDGTKMYVLGNAGNDVNEYDLLIPWNVSSASFNQLFSVSSEETTPTGVFFKPDGTKMYVIGAIGDDVNEYDLLIPWNVSSASFNQLFSVSSEEIFPTGVFFKPDGTKMYVIGIIGVGVNEYDLSTPWNVSTASFNQLFSVASEDSSPRGIFFKPDGTKMYVVGNSGVDVNEYDLSTPWNVSTASFNQLFSVSSEETTPTGVFFKPDGTKMYVVGNSGVDVNEYDLGILVGGNIISGANVTADYFIGDGSLLTGISSGNSSFNQTLTDSLYYSITNPFGFYNSTTLQNVSQLVNDFGYYNVTTLPSSTGNSTAWNRSGTNVFLANSGDSVGIGISSPESKLHTTGGDVVIEI